MLRIPTVNSNTMFNWYTPNTVEQMRATSATDLSMRPGSLQTIMPLFAQSYQAQQSAFKQSVQEFQDGLSGVAGAAKGVNRTLFDQKYVSGDNSAVTGTAKTTATTTDYDVGVTQLASAQRNDSKAVSGNGFGALSSGVHTIGITVGNGAEKQLNVGILASDTNRQSLTKVAGAINNAKLGVTAEVKTDKTGQQFLSVQGKDSGAAQTFSIRDVSGNAVASLNLNNTVQKAADAQYSVNGKSYTSSNNKAVLDNGNVTLEFNALTTTKGGAATTTKVQVGKESGQVVAAVRDMVSAYNKLTDTLGEADLTRKGMRLAGSLNGVISESRRSELAGMGISQEQTSGKLVLDDKKLAAAVAAKPERVETLLAGPGGLAQKLENTTQAAIKSSPNQYLQAPNLLDYNAYNQQAQATNLQALLGGSGNSFQGYFMDMRV